jgi:hypothetical protein
VRRFIRMPLRSGRKFHVRRVCLWFRNRQPLQAKSVKVEGNCLPHVLFYFFAGVASRNASREIWGVGGKTSLRRFDNDQVFFHGFNPACFRILFNVPGAKSSPGLPGTVTRPSLAVCLYWWWLPRVLTITHPSCSSMRMTSRTFTGSNYALCCFTSTPSILVRRPAEALKYAAG